MPSLSLYKSFATSARYLQRSPTGSLSKTLNHQTQSRPATKRDGRKRKTVRRISLTAEVEEKMLESMPIALVLEPKVYVAAVELVAPRLSHRQLPRQIQSQALSFTFLLRSWLQYMTQTDVVPHNNPTLSRPKEPPFQRVWRPILTIPTRQPISLTQ